MEPVPVHASRKQSFDLRGHADNRYRAPRILDWISEPTIHDGELLDTCREPYPLPYLCISPMKDHAGSKVRARENPAKDFGP